MKLKPLGDRIVIRRFQSEEKTTGGILLPDGAFSLADRITMVGDYGDAAGLPTDAPTPPGPSAHELATLGWQPPAL